MSQLTSNLLYHSKPARYFTRGRTSPIRSIIVHSTDGHMAGDLATLAGETDRKVSVHWYVTRTGEVWHLVDNCDTAYHAGVVCAAMYANAASIGIEQEHIDGDQDWPAVQIRAVAQIVALCEQQTGHVLLVVGHYEAAPGRKVDPVHYPWTQFRQELQAARLQKWVGVKVA